MQDWIVEMDGKKFVDVVKLLPERLDEYREIIKEINENKITLYTKIRVKGKGKGSKKVVINRLIELDDLFFEGLGLWQAEGSKDKGLYFGNTSIELLLRFIEFVESKIDLSRNQFKVTVSVPKILDEEEIKRRWSKILDIPIECFTRASLKPKTNLEFAHLYINSIILIEVMKNLQERLQSLIMQNKNFAAAYMRGIIAGEGQVELKKWGTISYISISSINMRDVEFYKKCLESLEISSGTYENSSRKFPIYGRRNFEKVKLFDLLKLTSTKKKEFNIGFNNYQRNVSNPNELKKLILQQLLIPKTYKELAKIFNKGRSTIQSYYIPALETENLVKRTGKQKRAVLFKITEKGVNSISV